MRGATCHAYEGTYGHCSAGSETKEIVSQQSFRGVFEGADRDVSYQKVFRAVEV